MTLALEPSAARLSPHAENAKKSQGPVSIEGKNRSRANSTTHGLSGQGIVRLPDEADAVAQRKADWKPRFLLGDPLREWAYDVMILASIRYDRCREHVGNQMLEDARRAEAGWDLDRAAEAETLGARLPRDPGPIAARLRQFLQGAEWLLDRWESLGRILDTNETWDDAQRSLALDLLGIPAQTRAYHLDHLAQRSLDDLRNLVRDEVEGLKSCVTNFLKARDQRAQTLAMAGVPVVESPELRRFRRYEAAQQRTFRWAFNFLQGKARPCPASITPPPALAEALAALQPSSEPTPVASHTEASTCKSTSSDPKPASLPATATPAQTHRSKPGFQSAEVHERRFAALDRLRDLVLPPAEPDLNSLLARPTPEPQRPSKHRDPRPQRKRSRRP